MFRKMIIRRRSIVLTWLFSYLTILLLPILLSCIVYILSVKTLESEIHQANKALLNQVSEATENYFADMERLNFELTWNIQVQELLFSRKYSFIPNEYYYDLYQTTQHLKRYQLAYPQIDLFYIYMADRNTVILPSIVRETSFAYELLHRTRNLSYDYWLSILHQKNSKRFIPMTRLEEDGTEIRTVAVVSSYHTVKEHPIAANVVMIDQSRILKAFENMELFHKGYIFVMNEQNELLVSNSDKMTLHHFPVEQMTAPSGLIYYSAGNQQYEVMYMISPRSGFKYVSMMPSSVFWEKAERVRNLTLVSISVSLLGGGILTSIFLKKHYYPVRRLVQSFSNKSEIRYNSDVNEFHFIQQAIDNTLLKMDSMATLMEQQRYVLRSNFISRLLKGRTDGKIPIDESLEAFHMRFESDDFAVLIFSVDPDSPFYRKIAVIEPENKWKLLQFIVTNVVEELASRLNHGYVAEMDETFVCLVNFRQTRQEDRKRELLRIAREAKQFLADHYSLGLTVSISGIHSRIAGIATAYSEALEAMEYKLVMGSKEILSYEELQTESAEGKEVGYYYPLPVEQQLINFVKFGDFDNARQTFDDIIDRNFRRPAMSVSVARCLMLNLVSTLMKAIGEIGNDQESTLILNPKQIDRIVDCDTIWEMRKQLTELLSHVCVYAADKRQQNMQQKRKQALDDLISRIFQLVAEKYADPNLNISMIGRQLDMKPTYLSKLFKEQTGEGLLDYINQYRIKQAKKLLKENGNNISDVAARVGYSDVNSFIRTFKKHEGITPGKFKEIGI